MEKKTAEKTVQAKVKQKKTLRVQIITAVTGLVTFVAIVSGFSTAYLVNKNVQGTLERTLPPSAVAAAQAVTKEIQMMTYIAQGISSDTVLHDTEAEPAQIAAFLSAQVKVRDLAGAGYYNATGLLMNSNKNFSSSEFFQRAVQGDTYISSPYTDESSKQLVIMVAVPVWKGGNVNGSVAGVVSLLVKQETINSIAQSTKVSKGSIAYIVDKNGFTIADEDVQLVAEQENIPQTAQSNSALQSLAVIYTKAMAGETGFGRYSYKGVEKFVAYAPIAGTDGWSLLIGAPESDFTGGVTRAIIIAVIIMFASIAIGFGIATVMTKSLEVAISGVLVRLSSFAEGDVFSPMLDFSANSYESVKLKNLTKTATENTAAVVEDIDYLLTEMADGNFDLHSKASDRYIGDFENISKSMHALKESINESFHNIHQVSEQVSAGASQVSTGAQTLAQGATEQASSVQELSASIMDISERVRANAEAAEQAKSRTSETESIVQGSVSDMALARQAMDEISMTSKNISKVIKSIDDIAFQTNILALNAAVEAARAGAAGKGFAVVADEVRNLSQKSAEAAKNTAALIESSIEAVEKGAQIVNRTSQGFSEVALKTADVANLVEAISINAQEQASAIAQVSTGIEQVSSVVQMNSATSEESAAASEQLSGQAEALKGLINRFKLVQD